MTPAELEAVRERADGCCYCGRNYALGQCAECSAAWRDREDLIAYVDLLKEQLRAVNESEGGV